jgi:peptidoglycan LD-endopeptidase LytH
MVSRKVIAAALVAATVIIVAALLLMTVPHGDSDRAGPESPRNATVGVGDPTDTGAAGDGTVPTSPASAAAPEATEPKQPPLRYVFPIRRCETQYGPVHHHYPAADIFARRGCRFVAPVAGTVEAVSRRDRWDPTANHGQLRGGRSVSILGIDGVRYYGSHLQSVAPRVRPGVEVRRGQLLGRVGDSGSARGTGPHVHFGISWPTDPDHWWVRRGVVAPQRYLNAWRAGRHLSPQRQVRLAEKRQGPMDQCRDYC